MRFAKSKIRKATWKFRVPVHCCADYLKHRGAKLRISSEKLMTLLKKLETDGVRIQLDIEEYAELNQRVMQLTTIVADSVGKLPDPPRN